MSKARLDSKETAQATVARLVEMSKLDTLFKDLYLHRARELLAPVLSRASYARFKENKAQIPWVEQQLRAGVERGEWQRCSELTERLRQLRTSIEGGAQAAKLAEAVYEQAADVFIDMFASGLGVFTGVESETLLQRRAEALNLLLALEREDPAKRDFYAHRISDFKRLSISATGKLDKEERVDPAQVQQAALSALDSGDLSKLEEMIASVARDTQNKKDKQSGVTVELTDAADLGDDLFFNFSVETLAAASELGLKPVRTQSRRHFAHLIPLGWQPAFRKDEVKQWSKEKISRLNFPSGTTDAVREAIDFYLLNPFINSGGTRYNVCLVAEDLLIEDFPEPEAKEEVYSKLLSLLRLNSRWNLSRIEIEDALLEHGLEVLQKLQLDPEVFRVVAVPPDIYTHLGPQLGWGLKEMWTHFDGYRVLEGGKLQALAGGDKRFGGTHDVVSFGAGYASPKIFARFAVVQRKRMMDWQK